ncbi:hypothetical protein V865_008060 [Kwoniella europaea PYCC6329]|uniref:Uncharacterized protein n=1 Tax=Kwoniella europaea PYCC6329 TaxID=1423913 RepID=A0AAX4KWF7_9TREE
MTVYEYDIFTPIPHSPSRRRHPHTHTHSLHSSKRRHSISSSTSSTTSVPFPVPGPGPTYIRPEQRQNHLGISFGMSPSIAEIMSTPPPLSPSSSSSMTYSSSSPTTPNSPSKLIFFPQPISFDHDDEEEDVFADTPSSYRNRSLAKRNINDDFSSLALGLGGIDKLPDEPFYPSTSSTFSGVNSLPNIPLNSTQLPSSGSGGDTNGNQLLPSAIPYSNSGISQPSETQKEKRKPFGHSFLPPLPPQQKGIPTPLLPMGFLPPLSSWQPPPHRSPTKSTLRRTDSDILLPFEAEIQAEETKRPIKLNGHMRKSSNDSEMTIKLGNGFVALGESPPQDTDDGKNGDFQSQPRNAMIINAYGHGYGIERRSKPNISRTLSQRDPTTVRHESHSGGSGSGNRYRSSSFSDINPKSPPRPSSPTPYSYKPHVSSPLNQNGRPTSPIPFAIDEYHFRPQGQATSGSRFTRPVSPSLPEDLLTPYAHNTYTHQTLSSAPERPKSPTTARESLNAVLIRHPKYEDDEDGEGYGKDSLGRLIRNAQKYESGPSSYFPNTPPKSPTSHPYTLPLPSNSNGIKSKRNAKRGFPILKSLFPPSPPPSSPSLNGLSAPDLEIQVEEHVRSSAISDAHVQRSFDVDKVNERLRTQRGRICFEELEGVGRPLFEHEDEDDDEGVVHRQGMNSHTRKIGKRDGSRPGTGRRWTLPF